MDGNFHTKLNVLVVSTLTPGINLKLKLLIQECLDPEFKQGQQDQPNTFVLIVIVS